MPLDKTWSPCIAPWPLVPRPARHRCRGTELAAVARSQFQRPVTAKAVIESACIEAADDRPKTLPVLHEFKDPGPPQTAPGQSERSHLVSLSALRATVEWAGPASTAPEGDSPSLAQTLTDRRFTFQPFFPNAASCARVPPVITFSVSARTESARQCRRPSSGRPPRFVRTAKPATGRAPCRRIEGTSPRGATRAVYACHRGQISRLALLGAFKPLNYRSGTCRNSPLGAPASDLTTCAYAQRPIRSSATGWSRDPRRSILPRATSRATLRLWLSGSGRREGVRSV